MIFKKSNLSTLFFLITTVVLAVLLLINKNSKEEVVSYDSTTVFTKISHIQELSTVKYNYTDRKSVV